MNCIRSLFDSEDSFTQTLSKVVSLLNMLIAPFAVAYGCYWLWLGIVGDEGAGFGSMLQGGLTILLAIIMVVHLILVFKWKHISEMHLNIIMWAILPPVCGTVFATPEFGSRMLLFWYSMLCVAQQSKHSPPQCIIAFIVQIISCYNDAYRQDSSATLLVIPGARVNGPPMEVLGELAGSTVVSTMCVIAVFVQGKAYKETFQQAKLGEEARAAVELARNVVEHLRKYDTDGVNELLESEEAINVDPLLVNAFRAMKENLDVYRPHLPNYIFQQNEEEEGGISTNQNDNDGRRNTQTEDSSRSAVTPPTNNSKTKYQNQSTFLQEETVVEVMSAGNDSGSDDDMNLSGSGNNTPLTTHGKQIAGSHSGGLNNSYQSSASLNNISGIRNLNQHRVTFAHLDCRQLTIGDDDAHLVSEDKLQSFIDTTYKIAADTKASIHTMVGDSVVISWNATYKVAAHTARAGKFLARVAQAAKKSQYQISGAAASGKCFLYTHTSTTKQQALMVHPQGWIGSLEAAMMLARRFSTVIIDESVYKEAHYETECRGVDFALYYQNSVVSSTNEALRGPRLALDVAPTNWVGIKSQRRHSNHLEASSGAPPVALATSTNSKFGNSSLGLKSFSFASSADMAGGNGKGNSFVDQVATLTQLYEVVKETKHEEGEWMYQLQTSATMNEGNSNVTIALENINRNNFSGALAGFSELKESRTNEKILKTPIVQRILKYCEKHGSPNVGSQMSGSSSSGNRM